MACYGFLSRTEKEGLAKGYPAMFASQALATLVEPTKNQNVLWNENVLDNVEEKIIQGTPEKYCNDIYI